MLNLDSGLLSICKISDNTYNVLFKNDIVEILSILNKVGVQGGGL